VAERTAALETLNTDLRREVTVREIAESRALTQLERLELLRRITQAIAERQDLHSIGHGHHHAHRLEAAPGGLRRDSRRRHHGTQQTAQARGVATVADGAGASAVPERRARIQRPQGF
jgi:hypothetical protein